MLLLYYCPFRLLMLTLHVGLESMCVPTIGLNSVQDMVEAPMVTANHLENMVSH